MLIAAFVHWWYGPGWRDSARRLSTRLRETYLTFSVPILLRTLVAPWRRIITYPGAGIGERFRAILDNLISRLIGMTVRLLALLLAGLILAAYAILGGLLLVLWPVIPVLGPLLILWGVL